VLALLLPVRAEFVTCQLPTYSIHWLLCSWLRQQHSGGWVVQQLRLDGARQHICAAVCGEQHSMWFAMP
jgi:hypothetical protein